MQEQVYKNLTAVFDTLNNIADLITNKQPQEFEDIKQDVREWIDNCCVILETIEQTVSNLNDVSSEKILNKARRNLYAMDVMVFNRFDISKFDEETHIRFINKMNRWITYYIDRINEVRLSYYIYDKH